jgi:hypothetical protein
LFLLFAKSCFWDSAFSVYWRFRCGLNAQPLGLFHYPAVPVFVSLSSQINSLAKTLCACLRQNIWGSTNRKQTSGCAVWLPKLSKRPHHHYCPLNGLVYNFRSASTLNSMSSLQMRLFRGQMTICGVFFGVKFHNTC